MSEPAPSRRATPARPNVVLIVSDDHGYADRGALGRHTDVRTPALDRLAAEGVSCTEAYVTAPSCSPSRAGLIAGQHQARWGARWFDDSCFPDHLPSLAERFADLGYATGYFGKVHYGPEDVSDRATPPHHGFEETFYGLAGQQTGRLNYLRHSAALAEELGPFAARVNAVQPMLEGDTPVDCDRFLTDELGERTRDFVTRHTAHASDPGDASDERDERPFFLMLAFNAVHNFCWQLPPEELERRGLPTQSGYEGDGSDYRGWYDGQVAPKLEHGRDYYLAQLELMDAQIGALLDTLDATGAADDTVVVYLTDNGGSNCNHADNTPLAGTKYTLQEGGIRVPFLWRWPGGGVTGGVERSGVVSSLDLYPTLLAAAGAERTAYDHCDGTDLLAFLRDGDPGLAERELHWDNGFQWAVRQGRWKLSFTDPESGEVEALREIERAEPILGLGLFDLVTDPGETRNLAEERPDVVDRLTTAHETWRASVLGTPQQPTGRVPDSTR
ncbi:arylsulfatase A-like enzyme [Knoellia remsis]|uniref:Arylsulfatase A-like enzyme n=1 Tax=Knoellia remsis TaxID=407159 RepID=A0A2T0UZI1_9MICO|nr:sulfatase-like hydrolase/transferase [Knoellia remsis]PRY63332.1 arylsulfatase A-like enzyme [Knoellia remsis]